MSTPNAHTAAAAGFCVLITPCVAAVISAAGAVLYVQGLILVDRFLALVQLALCLCVSGIAVATPLSIAAVLGALHQRRADR